MKEILKPNRAAVRKVGFLSLHETQGHIFLKNQVLPFGFLQDVQPITVKEPIVSAFGEVTIQSGGEAASQIIYTCGNCSKLLLLMSVHLTHLLHLLSPVPGDTKANTKIYQICCILPSQHYSFLVGGGVSTRKKKNTSSCNINAS